MPTASPARRLFETAVVWDTHAGFSPDPAADLSNLQRWRDAGVDYLSINVGYDVLPWQNAVKTLAAFRRWISAHGDEYVIVASANEVRKAKADGKMAVTFDLEGTNPLDGRLEMVELYYSLGVRQMLFAYNRNNAAGGGCHDEDSGLTDFGRAIIDEMNRLGMFVDVSHCSYRTSMEAIAYSRQPVIFSHSNARALCDHERNIRDEQIVACAQRGGVIGVNGISLFLGDPHVSSERFVDHVDYMIALAGPLHVGIGLDYVFPVGSEDVDAVVRANPHFWPPDRGYDVAEVTCAHPSQLLEVAEIMLRRGHSEQTIRGVLGENFLRLAAEIWK
ncbi:MAG TPA: membrane dipeptidase [Candidatus Baltobacteraceae bacterium]|nr:membrane dipeptidase [Candidatus Baltobacteraceae bacterium]